jgi:hypothetical protein
VKIACISPAIVVVDPSVRLLRTEGILGGHGRIPSMKKTSWHTALGFSQATITQFVSDIILDNLEMNCTC